MKKIILFVFCLACFAMAGTAQNQENIIQEQIEADMAKLELMLEHLHAKADAFKAGELEDAEEEALINEIFAIYKTFVKENPNSVFSLQLLGAMISEIDITESEALYNSLSLELRNSNQGKSLKAKIDAEKKTSIGATAPDFTLADVNGIPVKLSDFKGKYVLIDFWASWCGPCRKENPNLVKAYEQFKDKNFEILGVSLDNPGQKTAWTNAIRRDNLTWPQVSDLQGWQSAVAQLYGVFSIPQNFLIDPEGKIIAKGLRGAALSAKLVEILQ